MKKPALLILAILLFALVALYFIVPQWITTDSVAQVDNTDVNISKFLLSKREWARWWPGQRNAADSSKFTYNGADYTLQQATNTRMQVQVKKGDMVLNSQVTYVAAEEQMTAVDWHSAIQSSLNPFNRIIQFARAKQLQQDADTILGSFKRFMETDTNVYGIKVKIGHVADPIVIAQNAVFINYPTTQQIYKMVASLRLQINAAGAKEVNVPMLNIHRTDEHEYQVMVALPIDKIVTPGNGFIINKLVKNANLLETTVRGGRRNIDNAFERLGKYREDHRLISPAMPYEMILTDRLAQPDTTKWVTKVYWPIF
jgi:effector-binding domain-containing protein